MTNEKLETELIQLENARKQFLTIRVVALFMFFIALISTTLINLFLGMLIPQFLVIFYRLINKVKIKKEKEDIRDFYYKYKKLIEIDSGSISSGVESAA